jgi:hypothetical protein
MNVRPRTALLTAATVAVAAAGVAFHELRDTVSLHLRLKAVVDALRTGRRDAVRDAVTADFDRRLLAALDDRLLADVARALEARPGAPAAEAAIGEPTVAGDVSTLLFTSPRGGLAFDFRRERGEWRLSDIRFAGLEARRDGPVALAVFAWARALGEGDLAGVRDASSAAFAREVWSKPGLEPCLQRPEARRASEAPRLEPRPVRLEGNAAALRLEDATRWLEFRCVREDGAWKVDDVTIAADGEAIGLRETLRVLLAFRKEDK